MSNQITIQQNKIVEQKQKQIITNKQSATVGETTLKVAGAFGKIGFNVLDQAIDAIGHTLEFVAQPIVNKVYNSNPKLWDSINEQSDNLDNFIDSSFQKGKMMAIAKYQEYKEYNENLKKVNNNNEKRLIIMNTSLITSQAYEEREISNETSTLLREIKRLKRVYRESRNEETKQDCLDRLNYIKTKI